MVLLLQPERPLPGAGGPNDNQCQQASGISGTGSFARSVGDNPRWAKRSSAATSTRPDVGQRFVADAVVRLALAGQRMRSW
jgi:hypothetical protein